jgi:hypothetical protein
MPGSIADQSRLLEWIFDVVVQLLKDRGGDGFEFDDALAALDKAGMCSDLTDGRDRQIALTEQTQIGLTLLMRAKLIAQTVKPDFTRDALRLRIERRIGSLTGFGLFLARRDHSTRRGYLFVWSACDRIRALRRKWLWLFSAGQFITWAIAWIGGWRVHIASIEHTTAAAIVLCGAAVSAVVGWIISSLTKGA